MEEPKNYAPFCKSKNCQHFIEWECYGKMESCKLVGQSQIVDVIPDNCEFKEELENETKN